MPVLNQLNQERFRSSSNVMSVESQYGNCPTRTRILQSLNLSVDNQNDPQEDRPGPAEAMLF